MCVKNSKKVRKKFELKKKREKMKRAQKVEMFWELGIVGLMGTAIWLNVVGAFYLAFQMCK